MILTVTLNFALDLTYFVDRFERGATTRVGWVGRRAGGKGVNVARVLHALGRDVAVTGLAGGFTSRQGRAELKSAGLRDRLVEIEDESRITVVAVEEDGQATGFSERGPDVSDREWRVFADRFPALLKDAEAVVLSGSLPPGVPIDAYAQLISRARKRDLPVVLDADGEALEHGLRAKPALVKINATELASVGAEPDLLKAATALRREGAGAVVVSQGADGMTCVADGGAWRAAPPARLSGNPTGAGDAAAAALVMGLLGRKPWPTCLADATALSASAVRARLAGSFDAALYRRLRAEIVAHRTV